MQKLSRNTVKSKTYTQRVIQFGEGNFLRAFCDWMIHKMNQQLNFDAGVVVVQPIEHGLVDLLNEQDGLYTLNLNGIKEGKAINEFDVIDCIEKGINPYTNFDDYLQLAQNPSFRFVISNTTEAGIAYNQNDKPTDNPPASFPAKVTLLLHKRYQHFSGADDKGLIFLPCELIDKNGAHLKRYVIQYANDWNLGSDFISWIENNNIFCNTLVDRIVSGFPKNRINEITKKLGYKDNLVVEGEQFHLWVIEGPEAVKEAFPADTCGLNVIFTNDLSPYRTRKVRILNGAHTSLVPVSYLYGIDKVRESLEDPVVGQFIEEAIAKNICPTLDFPEEELIQFSSDVLDRFRNPFLEHQLISISLNSVSKYKTRVLPSVLKFIGMKQELPNYLLFSLAALIVFYKGDRNGTAIMLRDDDAVLDFFKRQWEAHTPSEVVHQALSNTSFWGEDLTRQNGLGKAVSAYVDSILSNGMKEALKQLLN